ncbi:MAG TPA: amidohydrolase family protein [Candidatus Dormibacteraeota bacterium]|nr:amidohydrolase family protein [Candidatus Dormibacteraeota bacterium]
MRVDIHNHFYPAAYLALLEERGRGVRIRTDLQGRRYLEEAGTRLATLTPPMTELERRFAMMDAVGIDLQVLSLTAPNVYAFDADDAIVAARLVNDEYARLRAVHGRRLRCLASVPLGTGAEVEELDRAILQLGLDGVVVGTNVAGRTLDDPAFEEFWRRVDELRCPVLIHPMTPMVGTRHLEDHALVPMVGFPFDTTLAVTRLIWTGFLDRHPNLRLVALHAGGALPYLAGRLEIGADAYAECRQVEHRPTWYLGRLFYDTVSYHPPALRLLAESFGVGQVVFGTDYPHVIGDPVRVIASLDRAGFEPQDLERICWTNVRDGLGIALDPPGRS